MTGTGSDDVCTGGGVQSGRSYLLSGRENLLACRTQMHHSRK